ncbi:acyloxyacyl hydrolase [Amorphus sp. MBR-141]
MRSSALTGLALFLFAFPSQTFAQDPADSSPAKQASISVHAREWEFRLGGGAYDTGPFTANTFSGGTINVEILAPSPTFLSVFGAPRPYIGADVAVSDDPINIFYAGLNWQVQLNRMFYLGFSVGGSFNTDDKHAGDDGRIKDLGAPVLFHLQASAGVDLTEKLGLEVYLNHVSNASLASANDGLESTGARLVYRF